MKQYYVYMLTNKGNQRFYVGVTNDIVRRVYEHKNDLIEGYTKQFALHKLVYFEVFDYPDYAIKREKFLKKAFRNYKNSLVNKINPDWNDLYDMFVKE